MRRSAAGARDRSAVVQNAGHSATPSTASRWGCAGHFEAPPRRVPGGRLGLRQPAWVAEPQPLRRSSNCGCWDFGHFLDQCSIHRRCSRVAEDYRQVRSQLVPRAFTYDEVVVVDAPPEMCITRTEDAEANARASSPGAEAVGIAPPRPPMWWTANGAVPHCITQTFGAQGKSPGMHHAAPQRSGHDCQLQAQRRLFPRRLDRGMWNCASLRSRPTISPRSNAIWNRARLCGTSKSWMGKTRCKLYWNLPARNHTDLRRPQHARAVVGEIHGNPRPPANSAAPTILMFACSLTS